MVLDGTAGPNWNPSRMCNREQIICNNYPKLESFTYVQPRTEHLKQLFRSRTEHLKELFRPRTEHLKQLFRHRTEHLKELFRVIYTNEAIIQSKLHK